MPFCFHQLGHFSPKARVHGGQRSIPLEEPFPYRGGGLPPGIVEIVPHRHAVASLKGVIYVRQFVGARVERSEHLAVGAVVPRDRVALDACLYVESVDARVQKVVREDVAAVVAVAVLVAAADILSLARAVGEHDGHVDFRPSDDRKLLQSLHGGVDDPNDRIQRIAQLLEEGRGKYGQSGRGGTEQGGRQNPDGQSLTFFSTGNAYYDRRGGIDIYISFLDDMPP